MNIGIGFGAFLGALYYIVTRPYQACTKFMLATVLAIELNLAVFPAMILNNSLGYGIGISALLILLITSVAICLHKPSMNDENSISFNCPFCEEELRFFKSAESQLEPCTECNEIVTVTTDETVHRREKEEHLKLMHEAASSSMDDIDLEDAREVQAGSYRDPIHEARM